MKIKLLFLSFSTCVIICSSCTISKTKLLTQHAWQFDEAIVQTGYNQHGVYKKGIINTTQNKFDNNKFVFNKDGTGTILDGNHVTWPIIWSFDSKDDTKLTLEVKYTPPAKPIKMDWSYIQLSKNSLIYTQSYLDGEIGVLSVSKLIPAP